MSTKETLIAGALIALAGCGSAANHDSSESSGSSDSGKPTGEGGTGSMTDAGTTVRDAAPATYDATQPPPPTGPIGDLAAAQLLTQGTFGPTLDTVSHVGKSTYDDWFATQAAIPMSRTAPNVPKNGVPGNNSQVVWMTIATNGPDQLRQRMAFALSEILVVGQMNFDEEELGQYYDILAQYSLGNFRDLLDAVTLSPVMGVYLTYFKNAKADPSLNTHPDENYAREVMQLFTIGLYELNPDGSPRLSGGKPVPTYTQTTVENMAAVFTGWGSQPIPPHTIDQAWQYDADWYDPMVCYPDYHDTTAKTLVNNTPVPAGGDCTADLKIALDALFNHPNVGPFIGKQLIQRLVSSNPSPAYVSRVAAVFDDDGTGTRGNLLAVAKAILTDVEARTPGTGMGKIREPLLRFTEMYRAFAAADEAPDGGSVLNLSTVDSTQPTLDEYRTTVMAYNTLDEAALSAPAVFNFFRPDYLQPGPLAKAGLFAPELQITTEATVVNLLSNIEYLAYQYVDSGGIVHSGDDNSPAQINGSSVLLHTAAWEPYASDPAMLIDQLNVVLMSGQMPADLKAGLVSYITPIPDPALRVISANYMLMFSPQFTVQR